MKNCSARLCRHWPTFFPLFPRTTCRLPLRFLPLLCVWREGSETNPMTPRQPAQMTGQMWGCRTAHGPVFPRSSGLRWEKKSQKMESTLSWIRSPAVSARKKTRRGSGRRGVTVVRHAHGETFVKAAVLALVAVLLQDFAVVFALVVLQLEPDGSPEETLVGGKVCQKPVPSLPATGNAKLERKRTFRQGKQMRGASARAHFEMKGGSSDTHQQLLHTHVLL